MFLLGVIPRMQLRFAMYAVGNRQLLSIRIRRDTLEHRIRLSGLLIIRAFGI